MRAHIAAEAVSVRGAETSRESIASMGAPAALSAFSQAKPGAEATKSGHVKGLLYFSGSRRSTSVMCVEANSASRRNAAAASEAAEAAGQTPLSPRSLGTKSVYLARVSAC